MLVDICIKIYKVLTKLRFFFGELIVIEILTQIIDIFPKIWDILNKRFKIFNFCSKVNIF